MDHAISQLKESILKDNVVPDDKSYGVGPNGMDNPPVRGKKELQRIGPNILCTAASPNNSSHEWLVNESNGDHAIDTLKEPLPDEALYGDGILGLDHTPVPSNLRAADGPNSFSNAWLDQSLDVEAPCQSSCDIGSAECGGAVHLEEMLLNELVPETQLQGNGVTGLNSSLIDDNQLCEFPITVAKDVDALWVKCFMPQVSTINKGVTKRKRGRPRKTSTRVQVSVSDLDLDLISSSLKDPLDVTNTVWKRGLELGVSGFVDEFECIGQLVEMEKRDQLAIRRAAGLKE
ncbi:glycosyl transferase family 1 [Sesbania bispinosa]|nr:glycosyl transferase family 1 [Sesbania bispinosa]